MTKLYSTFLCSVLCSTTLAIGALLPVCAQAHSPAASSDLKDWTVLVFLNGKNSLDSFSSLDLNEMETVGSSDRVNVVVQWGSLENGSTKRLLVQKDNDSSRVTSPIVEDIGKVDFGDWQSLRDFIVWGAQHYPAKHYFVDVWDHGSGWHKSLHDVPAISDISFDDETGSSISTPDLGRALREASQQIGQRIDIYGSDACLMAMAEVSGEMLDSVNYFVGSEEEEPGDGWPYDRFLSAVQTMADNGDDLSPQALAKTLVSEYTKSYEDGHQGNSDDVTFSAFDLSQQSAFETNLKALKDEILGWSSSDVAKASSALKGTLHFAVSDYRDFADFESHLRKAGVSNLSVNTLDALDASFSKWVIANATTNGYAKAGGVAIWMPPSSSTFRTYQSSYQSLGFDQRTGWSAALQKMLSTSTF